MERRAFAPVLIVILTVVALLWTCLPAYAAPNAQSMSTSAAAKKSKTTRVVGWRNARKAAIKQAALGHLKVTGPSKRQVKLQKRSAGKWKTVRKLRTSPKRGLDLAFLAEKPGMWRLVVPRSKRWTRKKTRALRIRTQAGGTASAGPTAAQEGSVTGPATRTVTATAGSGGVSGVYGSGFAIDSLQNIRVGGPYSESVSNRFRAERSGSLTAFRTWFKNHTNPGYGAGDGGIMSVTVETDNGGVPSGTVLGRAEHRPGAPDANGINPGRFSLVSFDAPVPVIAGQVYHVVYRNTSPDPQANYSSVNGTYIFGSNRPSPLQPLWTDDSLASLRKIGSKAWTVFAGVSPMLDLTYADGTHQGQGYIEPVYSSPAITGASKMVRERFTVSGGDRLVTGASVRIAKTSGTGDLVVRLEKGDGTLVDSLKIPTADVPTLDRTANGPAGIWVSGSFSSPRTLANGATYHLRLSTDQTTTLWTRIIKSGDGYGFNPATNFHDGYAQVTTDGGSTWAYGPSANENGELQFALH